MALSFKHRVLIDSRDVDGNGYCRASALLGHLQEAATQAAQQGGFSRESLLDRYHAFWMLSRMWFRLDRPLRWDEELTIHTWHRGGKSALMYRDYDLSVRGENVGEGVSAWVLADQNSRRLLRLGNIEELANTSGGALCKSVTLAKLRHPEELHTVERRRMRYSDTDINGHVNNTRYADFACDALEMDKLSPDLFLNAMQIGYLAECRPGEELLLQLGEQGNGRYVRGIDDGGKSRFEAALFFGKVLH